MKYKTTCKAIKQGSSNIVSVGYCDACNLFYNHTPIAYTCGIYGWNFDVYEFYGITVCTGYRGMPGKRQIRIGEYDKKASEILSWENTSMTHDEKKQAVENLLIEWCKLQKEG